MLIKYFAWIKNITGTEEEIIEDSYIVDIKSLKHFLKKKYPKLKEHFNNNIINIAINLEYTTENEKLKSKDVIAFFPPVSGG